MNEAIFKAFGERRTVEKPWVEATAPGNWLSILEIRRVRIREPGKRRGQAFSLQFCLMPSAWSAPIGFLPIYDGNMR